MKQIYILNPGYVTSKTDGQRHYISAVQLAELYRVDMRDCTIYQPGLVVKSPRPTRHLYPRFDGNYTLPGGGR